MDTPTDQLTLGIAATRIGGGVQYHHLRRLAQRGAIPHTRAGHICLVAVADLRLIRTACEVAGYLRQTEEVACE